MENSERFKLLDCNRKAILALPSGAVHLWLCYYMHENDVQESYLSLTVIQNRTGMDIKTIQRWRDYLLEQNWLVDTGQTAAQVYGKNATRGSHQVHVYRVDDPTKSPIGNIPIGNIPIGDQAHTVTNTTLTVSSIGKIPTGENSRNNNKTIESELTKSPIGENTIGKIPNKVLGLGLGLGLEGSCSELGVGVDVPIGSRRSVNTPLPQNNKSTSTSNSSTMVDSPIGKIPTGKVAKDGTPWPPDFNDWSNLDRTTWLDDHAGVTSKTTAKPNSKPPCPHCGVVPAAFGCECI